MSTKLKDIAHLTGVSINTVSRALKDKADIGEKTKERVKQAAKTLGYTPNIVARGLVLKRSFTIGLVVTELSNPTRGVLVDALRQMAIAKGYQLLVSGYEGETEIEASIREMGARGVDGMILGNISGIISEKTFWPALESTTRSGIPAVTFYEALTGRIDNVFVDYSLVTEELTRHLIEKHGLKKILFAANTLGYRRGEGYERAMRLAGLQKNIGLIPFNGWKMEDARLPLLDDSFGAKIAEIGRAQTQESAQDLVGVLA